MLNNYLPVFQSSCIEGIQVNEELLQMVAGMNPILATLLSPKIGYLHAAELAEESMKTNQPIKDLVIARGILSEEEANRLFDLETISKNRYRGNEV